MQMRPLKQVVYIIFERRTALESRDIQAVNTGTAVVGQRKSVDRAQGNFETRINE